MKRTTKLIAVLLVGLPCALAITGACGKGGEKIGAGPSSGGTGGSTVAGTGGFGASTGLGGGTVITLPANNDASGIADAEIIVPSADANCGVTSVDTIRKPANLLLVLDRSNSMELDVAGQTPCAANATMCTTRWKAITQALGQVLPQTENEVDWGLKLFATSPNGCDVAAGVDVAPVAKNASAIDSVIARTGPSTGTPTTEVIKVAATYLASLTDDRPKYILLATDGQPYCGGPRKDQPDDQNAIDSIANNAVAKGIPVFVVGISIDAATVATLNKMAEAGGKPRTDPDRKFYPANSPADLLTALTSISKQVASCSFTLSSTPPDPKNMAVYLDDLRLPDNAANGWILDKAKNSVEITGTFCDDLQSGRAKNAKVFFGCAPIPIGHAPR